MADAYVHGIVINPSKNEIRLVRSPPQDVIGVVGTAPEADQGFVVDTPAVVFKKDEAISKVYRKDSTGEKGSLYDAIVGIYAQADATVVMVRAKSDSTEDISSALEKLLNAESSLGYKPKIICHPGFGHTLIQPTLVVTEPQSNPGESEIIPTPSPVVIEPRNPRNPRGT